MKTIELTRGYEVVVDDDWWELLRWRSWRLHVNSIGNVYAARYAGVRRGYRIYVWLHRLVAGFPYPYHIGFRNQNSLDCSRGNIVVRLGELEVPAIGGSVAGQSKFLGVCWDSERDLWALRFPGLPYVVDAFRTELEAAYQYNMLAVQVFGRGVRINDLQLYTSAGRGVVALG